MIIPRPLSVTALALLVFSFSIFEFIRFVLVLQSWKFLEGVLAISPAYLVLTSLCWFIIGIILVWGIWNGIPWAGKVTFYGLITYLMYYWIDRLFIQNYSERDSNTVFMIIVDAFLIVWSIWVFSRPKTKLFFGANYD